ncbi:MAG TPA: hypothetical protein VHZ78_04140 [Rhizomicrobium sp.]|nr:hypothetical protein [Rhizomicrobium sp.]
MSKIPVVATVVASYRFVFANYLRLLGIAWASTAITMALLLSMVILGLVFLGITLAVTLPLTIGIGVATAAKEGPHPDPTAIAAQIRAYQPIITAVIYAIMLFIVARLAFFLPSIVLLEKQLGLGRNWQLSKGNSWRIAGLIVMIMLPLLALGVLQLVALAVFGGPDYWALFGTPPASLIASRDMMQFYLRHFYVLAPVALLLYPLGYGPFLAASAIAYRAVAGDVPPAQD